MVHHTTQISQNQPPLTTKGSGDLGSISSHKDPTPIGDAGCPWEWPPTDVTPRDITLEGLPPPSPYLRRDFLNFGISTKQCFSVYTPLYSSAIRRPFKQCIGIIVMTFFCISFTFLIKGVPRVKQLIPPDVVDARNIGMIVAHGVCLLENTRVTYFCDNTSISIYLLYVSVFSPPEYKFQMKSFTIIMHGCNFGFIHLKRLTPHSFLYFIWRVFPLK